jgi:acetyl/propionyl-CoA carboxylase alpha subunit
MIEKLVIANRGEIASRVIRTAKRLGIRTVAVHSEADARAVHVGEADERYPLGPAAARDTAGKIEEILAAARDTGSDAVHPGYGFRLESAEFARACRGAGLTFVGPSTEAIATMSSKLTARAVAVKAGVPVVPGTGALGDLDEARAAASALGYPLVLKAAAGGGGLGLVPVASEEELTRHFHALGQRAERLFGDGTLYLEKRLSPVHHVDVQLAGDTHGNLVHLVERDCSVQLRHQKLVEEAPAGYVDDELGERLAAAALEVGHAVHLSCIGSVELLVSGKDLWFLEMNTRLQVEHGVTELVTGIDLVEWQLRVAMGEELPARQQDIRFRGHAVQVRIHAEDPARGYTPSSGRITRFLVPRHPDVRNDVGVVQGEQVQAYDDPLIAKIVVHGPNRPAAVERLQRALADCQIEGLPTNLELLRRIVVDPEFVGGRTSTELVSERFGL